MRGRKESTRCGPSSSEVAQQGQTTAVDRQRAISAQKQPPSRHSLLQTIIAANISRLFCMPRRDSGPRGQHRFHTRFGGADQRAGEGRDQVQSERSMETLGADLEWRAPCHLTPACPGLTRTRSRFLASALNQPVLARGWVAQLSRYPTRRPSGNVNVASRLVGSRAFRTKTPIESLRRDRRSRGQEVVNYLVFPYGFIYKYKK